MNKKTRTYAEIDLDALRHNAREVKKAIPDGCKICAAVKANAYGHGVITVSNEFFKCGIDCFGVASLEEALELREGKVEGDILILGYTPPEAAAELIKSDIVQCIYSREMAEEFSAAAVSAGKTVRAHLKVDTGMGRIGIDCRRSEQIDSAVSEAERICSLPGLRFEGAFTHLACSNEENFLFTLEQYNRFSAVLNRLSLKGISFQIKHCLNSSGIMHFPEFAMDMVRPGIILYGLSPDMDVKGGRQLDIRPVMSLKTIVSNIKTVEKGDTVSYDRTYAAPSRRVIATAPVGYADGYPRALGNCAEVLVAGRRAPVVGRVCMDQIMFDITEIDGVSLHDEVLLFGRMNGHSLSCNELARCADTISYEIITRISPRVPRIFL